jgi:hypothetical protein
MKCAAHVTSTQCDERTMGKGSVRLGVGMCGVCWWGREQRKRAGRRINEGAGTRKWTCCVRTYVTRRTERLEDRVRGSRGIFWSFWYVLYCCVVRVARRREYTLEALSRKYLVNFFSSGLRSTYYGSLPYVPIRTLSLSNARGVLPVRTFLRLTTVRN